MLKTNVLKYLELGSTLLGTHISFLNLQYPKHRAYSDRPLTAEQDQENIQQFEKARQEIRQTLEELRALCTELDLPVSLSLLSKRIRTLPETKEEYGVLVDAVNAELGSKLFLFVPSHRSEYYERNDLLSDQAKSQFPVASGELRKSANAYALGLPNACVYHAMGALESGLRVIALDVSVKFETQNWQNVIDQIESAIRSEAKTLSHGSQRLIRLQFLSEAAKEFSYFKDGWRNFSAHNKVNYEEAQALTVLSHVVAFFETLSKQLSEDPLKQMLA